jgi:carbonic anhydrase
MATIIHGSILLIAAILIPRYLNLIPLASLAIILLVVGYKLAKPALFKAMYQLGSDQFIPFIVTIISILLTDLLRGIGIGMAVAIYFILRKNYQYSYHYKSETKHEQETITITLSEEVTFLNKGSIQHTLSQVPENCHLIIDGRNSRNIDYDVLEIIQNFKKFTAADKNIHVHTMGIKEINSTGAH